MAVPPIPLLLPSSAMDDMDVDPQPAASSQPNLNAEANISALSSVLSQLETSPDNVPLIKRQIRLMKELQMSAEVLQATEGLASLVMLSEDMWLEYLEELIRAARPLTLDSFVDILERFELGEQDYISVRILLRHADFITSSASAETTADPDVVAFLTPDTVREFLRTISTRSSGLLNESNLVWRRWLDWEMSFNPLPIDQLHQLFVDRMSTPHSDMDATASDYSKFCSDYSPNDYETRMVAATAASQSAKTKWSLEKRFGKTREDLEMQLSTMDPVQVFPSYIDWETDPRARNPKHDRAPSTDPRLVCAIFERAIAACAKAADALDIIIPTLRGKGKGKAKADPEAETRFAQIMAYKSLEASWWERYAAWVPDSPIRSRAVRACPQIGQTWCQFGYEMQVSGLDTNPTFERAWSLGLLSQPNDLAEMFVCRASFLKSSPEDCLATIQRGFEAIVNVNKSGDPSLRLEKFALDWAETLHPDSLDEALRLIEPPLKCRAVSYQMVILRTAVETRRGNLDAARQQFINAIQRSDLDWPEAVYEAWQQFETVHGDVHTLLAANKEIKAEQQKVQRRREKAAEVAMAQTAPAPAVEAVSAAPDPAAWVSQQQVEPTPAAPVQDSFKRDRENTTVLVTGLSDNIDVAKINEYFSDCGHIRETTLLPSAALIEFRFADAVPGALTRDKRKLDGQQINVTMLWRCTLFVTNFPRDMDDAGIRQMFSQYGTILQTRWPSRKYADSRRFCYITMDSPASAQESLILHGMKLEGFGLSVLISDPSAKTKRTDADDSANRTLFVGGLTPKTTEHDVKVLFGAHGTVRHVKIGWDPVKRICKGFAFVEMATEDEAKACLTLHGTSRDGRFLKVEISDPNHTRKDAEGAPAARRARTIRLHNLPEGTQEGLLQQALEKIVPVRRLEMFARSQEAIAELESEADVGKLLLRPGPFIFNEATITFTEQKSRVESLIPPHAIHGRPGKAIRKARPAPKGPTAATAAATSTGAASNNPSADATDGSTNNSQDFFRNLVQSTNDQRSEGNKRKADETGDGESKRKR